MKKLTAVLILIICLFISACSDAGVVNEPAKPDDSVEAVSSGEAIGEPDAATEAAIELETEEERAARLAAEETARKTEEYLSAALEAERAAREKTAGGKGGVVYLTFDDGPCGYTDDVLEILAKYNVKATFFLTAQHPRQLGYITDIYNAGHSIGLHSYSHEYYLCYASEEAFYEETEKMSDVIEEYAGIRPVIMRFPGGSSNAVSKKYCEGIMTAVTQGVEEKGYTYFDWNVGSSDTASDATVNSIINNVIAGIKKHDESVVLMHDFKINSVKALPSIIEWGLENGYEFVGLTPESPTCHFKVKN